MQWPSSGSNFGPLSKAKEHDRGSSRMGKTAISRLSALLRKTPPKKSHPRIPVELYRLILCFLPPGTRVHPLLLVNSDFRHEAEYLLYRCIRLDQSLGVDPFYHRQVRVNLFHILASPPHLARLLQTLELPPFFPTLGLYFEDMLQVEYWIYLRCALRATPNLRELTIGGFTGLMGLCIGDIFDGCSFRLRRLAICQSGFRNIKILQSHQIAMEIEDLAVSPEIDVKFDATTGLPQLAILEVDSPHDDMPRLMEAPRRIRALYLTSATYGPRVRYGRTYPELRSLKIGPMLWPYVAVIGMAFPGLRFLRIDIAIAEDSKHLADITQILRSLAHLRKLTFGGDQLLSWTTSHLRQQVATQIFEESSVVEVVSFDGEEWWGRVELGDINESTRDKEDEWKDRRWWD